MHKLFLTACVLALLACSTGQCFAVLGETEAEVEKRYGKPVQVIMKPADAEPAAKKLVFDKNGIGIHVLIFEGHSASEEYHFRDDNGQAFPVRDSLKGVEVFLAGNAQGKKWLSMNDQPSDDKAAAELAWMRLDGNAGAWVWKKTPNVLEVTSMTFVSERGKSKASK